MSESVKVSYEVSEAGLAKIKADNCYLKLYTNDITPDGSMVPGTFTEAAGGGYAHKAVLTTDWTDETSNVPRDLILAEQAYTLSGLLTGPQTVYGWYLIKQDLSVVRVAKRLDTPYTPASGGGTLKFTPRVQAGNAASVA